MPSRPLKPLRRPYRRHAVALCQFPITLEWINAMILTGRLLIGRVEDVQDDARKQAEAAVREVA